MLDKKLGLIEYIYEDIGHDIFLYRKSIDDNFELIDKANDKRSERTIERLISWLEFAPIELGKFELLIDSILEQQSLYHKMVLEDHLKVLNLQLSDINIMQKELEIVLRDITKQYVKNRLYLVEDLDKNE